MFKHAAWLAGLVFGIASAAAADLPYKPIAVTTPDGLHILYTLGQYTAATVPGAKQSTFEGAGHASFFEQAPRFNRELAEFVTIVAK